MTNKSARKAYREEMLRQRDSNLSNHEAAIVEQENPHQNQLPVMHGSSPAGNLISTIFIWLMIAAIPLFLIITNADVGSWIIVIVLALSGTVIWVWAATSPEERKDMSDRSAYGQTNPKLLCPHCNTVGQVRTKFATHKKGISGAKATGALLTGGLSILATGLSRKEGATEAHCINCNSTWHF